MTAIVLIIAASLGSTARVSDSFTVRAPVNQIANWMIDNQDQVAASMKCRVIARKGNRVHVSKDTAKGTFEFILIEQIVQDRRNGDVRYTTDFEKSVRGPMTGNRVEVWLRNVNGKTLVTVDATASVTGIPRLQVQIGLNVANRGFRNFMERRFR